MHFSWNEPDGEAGTQAAGEQLEGGQTEGEEGEEGEEEHDGEGRESGSPRGDGRVSQDFHEVSGDVARQQFATRSASVRSMDSGFSSASYFDPFATPEPRRWGDLLASCCVLAFCLALVLGTALVTSSVKGMVLTEGAFGYSTQVSDEASAQWLRWRRAQRLASPQLQLGISGAASDVVTWRRMVLIYQLPESQAVSSVGMQRAKVVEDALKALPLWQSLCGEMPESYQRLCREGDSMVSASHGSYLQVSGTEASNGVEAKIELDGNGSEVLINLQTLTKLFEDEAPATIARWLPRSGDRESVLGQSTFRSSFIFGLRPQRAASDWRSLVADQVEPQLVRLGVMSPQREHQKDFRVFLEADDLSDLQSRELQRSMDEDLPLLVFGPLSAFLASLVRGRLLVALVAGVLALSVPLVTSVGLLSSCETSCEEVPIIAAAAWFVVSAGMADLCCACAHALEERKESLRPLVPEWVLVRMLATEQIWPGALEEASGAAGLALRVLRFSVEALLPTFVLGLTLLLAASGLEMVQTFTLHTGLGLLVGVPLAAMLVPPAMDVGDALAKKVHAWRNETDLEMSEALQVLFDNLFPIEFGAKQDWAVEFKFKTRKRMRDFLRLRWANIMVVMVLIGLVVVYCLFMLQEGAVYTAESPHLFEAGHRLYDKGQVSALFDYLEDYQAPLRDLLRTARRCKPDAADADCSWYKCEAAGEESKPDTQASECKCYQIQGKAGCAESAARIFGLEAAQAQQLLSEGIFWSWVGTRLNRVFPNATSRPAPFLEIEVWATGGRSLDLGVQSLAGAASWESACLQVLCFCGTMECRTADSWFNLGSLEVALGNPGLNESEGNASDALVEALGDVVNVSFAWGIQVSSEPLSATDGGLSYSRSLVLEDLWSQRQLLAFCEGTAPNLVVVRRNCWPIDFKRWLHERGSYYPVPSDTFYASLRQFFQDKAAEESASLSAPDQGSGFWLTAEGTATALYFSFSVVADPPGSGAPASEWQDYLRLRNSFAPSGLGPAWMAPSSAVLAAGERATAAVVQQNVRSAAIIFIVFPPVLVLLVTWSFGLALTSALLLAVSMMILQFHHARVSQQEVGVLELVALLAYSSAITLGLLRVSVHVAWTQDGPGKDPSRRRKKQVQAKKIGRLSVLEGICEEPQETQGAQLLRSVSYQFPKQVRRSVVRLAGAVGLASDEEAPTRKKLVEELDFPERKALMRRMAVLNSPAIFEGGLRHERLGRSSRGACRAGMEAFTMLLTLAISCMPVLFTALRGIAQVCLVGLAGGAVSVMVTFCFVPVLMLLGFGPSKVKQRAWAYVFWWRLSGAPEPLPEPSALPEGLLDTDLGTLGETAVKVLGPPFTWMKSRAPKSEAMETFELQVTLNNLDLKGATAMPPFHSAQVQRNKFGGEG